MLHIEKEKKFNVFVSIPDDGGTIKISQQAVSKWHAIELVFTKHHSAQPDRSKYTALEASNNR